MGTLCKKASNMEKFCHSFQMRMEVIKKQFCLFMNSFSNVPSIVKRIKCICVIMIRSEISRLIVSFLYPYRRLPPC